MKIKNVFKLKIFAALFILSTAAFADFCPCPSNFNLIKIGDSIQYIMTVCCAPTSQKKYKLEPPVPQKWTYYIKAQPDPGNTNTTQGSAEMTVVFDEKGKVTNITMNAYNLMTVNCGSTPTAYFGVNTSNSIQVGVDTLESVKKACGTTQFITKGIPQGNVLAPEIVELQYNGPPLVTLKFEDGKLTEIKK